MEAWEPLAEGSYFELRPIMVDAVTDRPRVTWWAQLEPDEARRAILLAYPDALEARWPRPGVALLEVGAEQLAAA